MDIGPLVGSDEPLSPMRLLDICEVRANVHRYAYVLGVKTKTVCAGPFTSINRVPMWYHSTG